MMVGQWGSMAQYEGPQSLQYIAYGKGSMGSKSCRDTSAPRLTLAELSLPYAVPNELKMF